MKGTPRPPGGASVLRSFVFGVEDSLVSTVGLLSGITIGGVEREAVLVTGLVLIFVEAISMAAGSFLAEYSAEEYEQQGYVSNRQSIINGVVMFFSYFISGFIPLAPYLFFDSSQALPISISLSLLALFLLGVVGAHISHVRVLRDGLRMLIVGGLAIAVGTIVGAFVS